MSIDKIGMYKTDEILEFMEEGEGRSFLGRSMFDAMYFEIERLNKALLDIKELVVNNACLSEEYNRCVDDLIYYKCDELLDIVNKALGSDK